MERTIIIRFTGQYVDVTSPMSWAKEHFQLIPKVSISPGFGPNSIMNRTWDIRDFQNNRAYNQIGYFCSENKLLLDIDTPIRTIKPKHECVMKKCNDFIEVFTDICKSPAHAILYMK